MVSLISGMPKEDKNGQKLRKKDVGMAKVSLVIVFIFIICHSVKWIPNIYELSKVVSYTSCQFHQHFYAQIFCTNVILAAFSSYVLALAKNLYEKCTRKMLMKLTPPVNFINISERLFHKKVFLAAFL